MIDVTWIKQRAMSYLPYLVALTVAAIVLGRLHQGPMQPYGDGSAQYIEHADRLHVLGDLLTLRADQVPQVLKITDGAYPPVLHLLTAAAGMVTGHSAQEVLWTGIAWLFLSFSQVKRPLK